MDTNNLIPQLVEEQVERRPDAVALVFRDEHVTYSFHLSARAIQRSTRRVCASPLVEEKLIL